MSNTIQYIDFLSSTGWSAERKVALPNEYLRYAMSEKSKNILSNLYSLTLCSSTQERKLFLERQDFTYFDEELDEACNDYKLSLKLYPLGTMSEYSGYIAIDDQGNFYLLDEELYFFWRQFERISAGCYL